MGKLSRDKSVAFEQRVASWQRELFGEATRGAQGGRFRTSADMPDVESPFFTIECKDRRRINVRDAVAQACLARKPGKFPMAVCHYYGDGFEDSLVAMRLDDFEDLIKEWKAGCER